MSEVLPMFGLNSVVFPGSSLPLHIFEDRYRAMVEHLVAIPDVSQRLFFTVAIREGYEVGDHGVQSMYRVGSRLQLTQVSQRSDGSYQVMAVARDRIRLEEIDTSQEFPRGQIEPLAEHGQADPLVVHTVMALWHRLGAALAPWGHELQTGPLPKDPGFLSWVLAAAMPLPMAERQSLLEATGPAERFETLHDLLISELRAIQAIPSLPAMELARTRWSPN